MGMLGAFGFPAAALGSGTIAGAPTVGFGQQEFGNTATDSQATCPQLQEQDSWWLLPATTGDRITIDYEGSGAREERLFPPDTNDFNYPSRDESPFQETASGGGRDEAVITIPHSGVWPLEFDSRGDCGSPNGGPYDFTAHVAHKVVLGVSYRTQRQHKTVFSIALHNPDGVKLTTPTLHCQLQRLSGGRFRTVRTSEAPCRMTVRWTARQRDAIQTVRVRVSGSGYQSVSSRNVHLKAV